MTDPVLSPRELRRLQQRYRQLQAEIAQLGWIAQGSLMHKASRAWRLTRKDHAKTTPRPSPWHSRPLRRRPLRRPSPITAGSKNSFTECAN